MIGDDHPMRVEGRCGLTEGEMTAMMRLSS
jgi:hypothetical protein